jgi:hypothetical protein
VPDENSAPLAPDAIAQTNGAGTRPIRVSGPLRSVIKASKRSTGENLADLTVLSPQADPYRFDTKAGHRDGRWFAEQVERFLPGGGTIHLRGQHYRISAPGTILKPDGKPYINDGDNWAFLEKASKAARWLLYLPFERITDARNGKPMLFSKGRWQVGDSVLSLEASFEPVEVPELSLADVPSIYTVGGRSHEQPFQIVFYGEKSSLAPVLESVAQEVSGDILLPTGEASDTMVFSMVQRAAADSRPLVVLYFSDFDPSGWQMSISVARKIQALRDLKFPDLQAQVYHVALTLDQALALNLPSTPLKESELRGDRWREIWGHEQTEIDAAIALAPDALAEIVRDAVKPFYDPTLDRRAQAVRSRWSDEEAQRFYDLELYGQAEDAINRANDEVRWAHEVWAKTISAARQVQEQWSDAINAAIEADPPAEPPIDTIEPNLAPAPDPMFTTDDGYATATRKLIDRKSLAGEGAP